VSLFYSGSDSRDGLPSELGLWRAHGSSLSRVGGIGLVSPSWVVPHPRLPLLYATRETEPGGVAAARIGPGGALKLAQEVPSGGALPCHLAVDAAGTRLVASNYLDGLVTAWDLTAHGMIGGQRDTWQLTGNGPVPGRQERSHAHAAYFWAGAVLAVDLGGDLIWRCDPGARPVPVLRLPAGFGPRHLVPLGAGRAAVVGELSAELALVELGPTGSRVLDTAPTSRAAGAQPSGVTAWRGRAIVANRGIGSFAKFAVAGDRLVWNAEVELPGTGPRALRALGNRLVVALQDVGLLATYALLDLDRQPDLARAPHVSDFGLVPAVEDPAGAPLTSR
jgi:6-phosphogluconolactonase (cycloisomerase 2 family)